LQRGSIGHSLFAGNVLVGYYRLDHRQVGSLAARRGFGRDLHPVQVITAKDSPVFLVDAIVCSWRC
jgi:hypothetical protein